MFWGRGVTVKLPKLWLSPATGGRACADLPRSRVKRPFLGVAVLSWPAVNISIPRGLCTDLPAATEVPH